MGTSSHRFPFDGQAVFQESWPTHGNWCTYQSLEFSVVRRSRKYYLIRSTRLDWAKTVSCDVRLGSSHSLMDRHPPAFSAIPSGQPAWLWSAVCDTEQVPRSQIRRADAGQHRARNSCKHDHHWSGHWSLHMRYTVDWTNLVHNVKPLTMNARMRACRFAFFNSAASSISLSCSVGHCFSDHSQTAFMFSIVMASAWFRRPPSAPHLFFMLFIRSAVAAALAGFPDTFPVSGLHWYGPRYISPHLYIQFEFWNSHSADLNWIHTCHPSTWWMPHGFRSLYSPLDPQLSTSAPRNCPMPLRRACWGDYWSTVLARLGRSMSPRMSAPHYYPGSSAFPQLMPPRSPFPSGHNGHSHSVFSSILGVPLWRPLLPSGVLPSSSETLIFLWVFSSLSVLEVKQSLRAYWNGRMLNPVECCSLDR